MTGVDTFYENLAILKMQLEACICRSGMDPTTCSRLCDGTFTLSCDPGYVEEYDQALGRPACVACPAGKYEYLGDCEFADSHSYVTSAGSSQYQGCPANTRVQDVSIENGQVFLRPRRGATSFEECVCERNFFLPSYANLAIWYVPPSEGNTTSGSTGNATQIVSTVNGWLQRNSSLRHFPAEACLPCVDGAVCDGARFPPIARPGYGMQRAQMEVPIFLKCRNFEQCVTQGNDGSCDCTGGAHNLSVPFPLGSVPNYDPYASQTYTCGSQYQNGSAFCSSCADGFGLKDNQCEECNSVTPSAVYQLQWFLIVLFWFPTLRFASQKRLKSLYTTFGFLQFLGVFSNPSRFRLKFKPWFKGFLQQAQILLLSPDFIHYSCSGTSYEVTSALIIMAFPPALYLSAVLIHITLEAICTFLARRSLPPTTILMFRFNWRPRRDWSLQNTIDTYGPTALFYLNMYYITGSFKSFELLYCSPDGEGGHYLRAAPSIVC